MKSQFVVTSNQKKAGARQTATVGSIATEGSHIWKDPFGEMGGEHVSPPDE